MFIIFILTSIFFYCLQRAKILSLSEANKYRRMSYDSDKEHQSRKRARLGLQRTNDLAAVQSYRQHVQDAPVSEASVRIDADERELNDFLGTGEDEDEEHEAI